MPRSVSSVTGSKLEPPTCPTQTLSTPSTGARYASRVPSGDMAGAAFSGLPKRTERGMRVGAVEVIGMESGLQRGLAAPPPHPAGGEHDGDDRQHQQEEQQRQRRWVAGWR